MISCKKIALFLGLTLLLGLCVALGEGAKLDPAAFSVLKAAHPNATPSVYTRKGDTIALAFEQGREKFLCVLELKNGQWGMSVNNPKALLPGKALPSLLLDTEEALYWNYQEDPKQKRSFFAKKDDGQWNFRNEVISSSSDISEAIFEDIYFWQDVKGGQFVHRISCQDKNGNLLHHQPVITRRFPAMWLKDQEALNSVDITHFLALEAPENAVQGPQKSYLQEAAAYFMPHYRYMGGSYQEEQLQFLMEKPDGTHVLVGCVLNPDWRLTEESAPLPQDVSYGFENFTHSLNFRGKAVTLRYIPSLSTWNIWVANFEGEDLFFGYHMVKDQAGWFYLGRHPWGDIRTLDLNKLPKTLLEALAGMSNDGFAVVANPNPADRLHLRTRPDKSSPSFGKYYNGTPVRVLSTQKDWTQVDVFGQVGWMMSAYLNFEWPYAFRIKGIMPQLEPKDTSAGLCKAMDVSTQIRQLMTHEVSEMYVIGIIGDTWYHVWFPYTNETGFVLQSELGPGHG